MTPALDERTRTATARVVLPSPDPDRAWLPGLFVTGRTIEGVDAAVVVPRSAIQRVGVAPTVPTTRSRSTR